jgi:hypothetical protein
MNTRKLPALPKSRARINLNSNSLAIVLISHPTSQRLRGARLSGFALAFLKTRDRLIERGCRWQRQKRASVVRRRHIRHRDEKRIHFISSTAKSAPASRRNQTHKTPNDKGKLPHQHTAVPRDSRRVKQNRFYFTSFLNQGAISCACQQFDSSDQNVLRLTHASPQQVPPKLTFR